MALGVHKQWELVLWCGNTCCHREGITGCSGHGARAGGWHTWAVQAEDGGTPYLVDVRHRVSGGAPVRTELGRQWLPLLGEHMHMWGVHQHRHDTQALLLQWVEHHQVPVEWGHTGMVTPAPWHPGCPMLHTTHGSHAPTHCFMES